LRVPDLRRILLEHEIDFPSSAKKGSLVDIFNENLAGDNAARILKKRRQTMSSVSPAKRRSSPPTSLPRSPSRKHTAHEVVKQEEDEDLSSTPILRAGRRTPITETKRSQTGSTKRRLGEASTSQNLSSGDEAQGGSPTKRPGSSGRKRRRESVNVSKVFAAEESIEGSIIHNGKGIQNHTKEVAHRAVRGFSSMKSIVSASVLVVLSAGGIYVHDRSAIGYCDTKPQRMEFI
jgi:hypothetical protein